MRLYKNRKISIGSISTGTMRTEDLIPTFLDTLAYYAPRTAEHIIRKYDVLLDALNHIAPPFAHFGSHPGDGADYGFWYDDFDELIQDGTLLQFDDATRNPTRVELQGYTHYARVSDHGNITIYNRAHRFVCAIV